MKSRNLKHGPSMLIFGAFAVIVLMATGALGQTCERLGRGETCMVTANEILSGDFNGVIVIAQDGITLDCTLKTVNAEGDVRTAVAGITLEGRTGVTIRNCIVRNSFRGFLIRNSKMNVLEGNEAERNEQEGFRLEGSDTNMFIRNRSISNGRDGFDIGNSKDNSFVNNTVTLNAVNGIELEFSNNNTFADNHVNENRQHGFSLDDSSDNKFFDNEANKNGGGGFPPRNNIGVGFQIVRRNNDNRFARNRASGNVERDADQSVDSLRNIFIDNAFVRSRNIQTIP